MAILIVEDSSTYRDELVSIFSEKNGLPCITAGSAQNGLELWENDQSITLIFVDYNMPGLTGLDMIRELRDIECSRGIDPSAGVNVVVLSAESSIALKKIAKELYVKVWVIKPVSDSALIEIAHKLI
ncbi:MAG: two-component system chemotaxis response regulator CheY [Cellvibrionaceae bacterium]|jgi:two-component system chemotaxis response regulator CheY